MKILIKISRRWTKLRLQPIRVFCLHNVCKQYDSESMNVGDWMHIDEFKNKILDLRKGNVEFISLEQAYKKMKADFIRPRKYAVLTFDDGYSSIKEIIPWLCEQKIPVTLFINGKYLDGVSYRKNPKEKYLNERELREIVNAADGLIEIGNHGWEHTDASILKPTEFEDSLQKNELILSTFLNYIPFWAYTWGRHNRLTDDTLQKHSIIPVLIDGMKNYHNVKYIHRELL